MTLFNSIKETLHTHRTTYVFPSMSGILLILTLPWINWWPLVFIALVPFIFFASNNTITHSRLIGGTLLMGFLYDTAVIFPLLRVNGSWWFDATGTGDGSGHLLLFAGSMILVGLWGALFFLPTAFIIRKYGTHPFGGWIIAVTWTMMEVIRSNGALFGYSWGVLGYALIDAPILKYGATLPGGVLILSLMIMLVNNMITDLLRPPDTLRFPWLNKNLLATGCLIIITVIVSAPGAVQACALPPLRVAVIASTLATEDSMSLGAYDYYRKALISALAQNAALIITPENALPFFEFDEEKHSLSKYGLIDIPDKAAFYDDFLSLSRAHPDVVIALGMHTVDHGKRFNSVILYQNGQAGEVYHKRKLVPFAEYAPLGLELPIFEKISPGENSGNLTIKGYSAAALICSEIDGIGFSRIRSLIISPSNDSVFVSPNEAIVHHQMARMRALESRAYLLRSSKGGISSIIDPSGNVLREGTSGVLTLDISPRCN